jgi:hypothetical protein
MTGHLQSQVSLKEGETSQSTKNKNEIQFIKYAYILMNTSCIRNV